MARPGLTGHRKFRRLVRTLGSSITAVGVLELLWQSCYESGDDYLGTAEDIEDRVEWKGEPGVLALALVQAGLPEGHGFIEPIEPCDGQPVTEIRYRVHDLWHHAPEYVSNRRTRENERRVPKVCQRKACGISYFSSDPRSKYCSAACRTAAWRDGHVTDGNKAVRHSDGDVTDRDGSPNTQHPVPEVPPNPPDGGRSGCVTTEPAKAGATALGPSRTTSRRISAPANYHVEPDTADRAGRFLERYQATYRKARNGAHYAMKPVRDFDYALQLVTNWVDDEYLDKMAELFLRKADWKPKNSPGTVGQFLHMAPECDALLAQHGHRPSRRAS